MKQVFSAWLAVSMFLPAPAPAGEPSACGSQPLASLELLNHESELPLVAVSINGRGVQMRLNTEYGGSSLRPGSVEWLKLPVEGVPKKAMTMNDQDVTALAHVTELSLGGMAMRDVFLQVLPAGVDSSKLPLEDHVGTLGMDLLAASDIEIDFPAKRMTLYSPSSCPGGGAVWAGAYSALPLRRTPYGNYYVVARLDGKRLEAAIATGSSVTRMTRETARRVYGIDAAPQTSRAMQLSAPPLKMADETIYFFDLPPSGCRLTLKDEAIGYVNCFNIFPLVFGMSTLRSLHVYLATRQNVMFFSSGARAVFAPADRAH